MNFDSETLVTRWTSNYCTRQAMYRRRMKLYDSLQIAVIFIDSETRKGKFFFRLKSTYSEKICHCSLAKVYSRLYIRFLPVPNHRARKESGALPACLRTKVAPVIFKYFLSISSCFIVTIFHTKTSVRKSEF